MKVLVVEDNFINRALLREVLVLNGFDVLEAQDGEQALDMLLTHKPRLICMDLNLPGMDGIEVARRVRSVSGFETIPIIAITASVMQDEQQKLFDEGFDGYVSKPISLKNIVKVINSVLEKASEVDSPVD